MIRNASNRRTIVTILSPMRSGSTLLKALLGQAEDVSHLSEVNFQRYFRHGDAISAISALDNARIIVLKRPAWYHETRSYPRLPRVPNLKQIVLVRDAYETIQSLRKMTLHRAQRLGAPVFNHLLLAYWYRVVNRLQFQASEANAVLVRYEDLVLQPCEVTLNLFRFIGSSQSVGVEEYREPTGIQWRWGRDDGGPRIRELRVMTPREHAYEDQRLLRIIMLQSRVMELRQRLGYPPLPE